MRKRITAWQKRVLILLLAAGLCFAWKIPAQAASKKGNQTNKKTEFTKSETAATINLSKTEGTVTVKKSSGSKTGKGADKEVKIIKNMRLLDGYHVNTEKESYAWVELDKSKLIKVDAVSEVEVRTSGKILEVLLDSGNMSFNITESLKDDETLNICTSSMIAGIRGTCGWVQIKSATCTRVYVLEGKLECTVIDPLTGEAKTDYIKGGEWALFSVLDKEQKGEKCVIDRGSFTEGDVPGFVLVDLVGDAKRCEEIFMDSGIDLRNLTAAEALERLAEDEEALSEALEELEKEIAEIESNISMDPVWKDEVEEGEKIAENVQPEPKKEQPSGSGNNGGSAPTPAPEENKKPNPAPKKETENVDVAKEPKDVENLLDDGKNVTVAGDDTSNIYRVDSDLHIPEGTTLTIKEGLTLAVGAAATITVDGTLKANGDVENNGKIIVNSNKSMHVKGGFSNYGSVINQNKGKIDAAQGIDNYGSVHCDGKSTLYSNSAEGTVRMRGDGCKLTVAGGDITNKKGGAALALEEAGQIDGVTFTEKTLLQSVSKNVVTIAGQALKVKDYATSYNDAEALYQFMIDKKKVTFIGGEGSETRTVSTLNGYALGKSIPKLTKAGYELTGYNTAADGSGSAFTKDTKVTEDITVYAQWKENPVTFTVTFDANGGTMTGDKTVTVPYNGKVTLPAPKAPKGYTFYGWYTAKDSKGVKVTGDEPIVKNVTYYARWILGESKEPEPLPEYKVTFNANGGTLAAGVSGTVTVKQGEKVAKPADPAREGYTFAGWCTDEACAAAYDFTAGVTADITLYAKWTIIKYKVTFDTNGGSFADSAAVVSSVNYGEKAVKPADPVKTGYIFDGWYLLNDQGEIESEKYGFDTPVTKDITLSAVWKPTERTVKFVVNTLPDMVLDGVKNIPEDQTVYYDALVTEPSPEPEYSDFLFDGWYTDEALEKKYDFETKVKGDMTLYAKWAKQVKVVYMLDNGAPVSTAAETLLKSAGYTFEKIEEDGVVIDTCLVRYVKAGDKAPAPAKALTDLLARVETEYEDWFIAYDGTPSTPQKKQDKNIVSLFYNWYTDTTLGEAFDFKETAIMEDLTVYAGWERQVYSGSTPIFAVFGGGYASVCGRDYTVAGGLNVNTTNPLRIRNINSDTTVNDVVSITAGSGMADITFAGINVNVPESMESNTVTFYSDATVRLAGENIINNDCQCDTIVSEGELKIIGEKGATLVLQPHGQGSGISAESTVNLEKVNLTIEDGYIYADAGNISISDNSTVTATAILANAGNISISGNSTVTVEGNGIGIDAEGATVGGDVKGTIEISGEKTVVDVTSNTDSGLYAKTGVKISGGKVTACTKAENVRSYEVDRYAGITSPGYLDISGGTVNSIGKDRGIHAFYINVTGGELNVNVTDMVDAGSMSGPTAHAVLFEKEFNVTGGKVSISEKNAAAVPYYGIYGTADGIVNISGGSVYVNAREGLYVDRNINISQTGSSATKVDIDFGERGIGVPDTINVSGGVVNVICTSDKISSPIAIQGKDITISGGTVTATGTTQGIYCDGDMEVSGGTVSATSTETATSATAAGIWLKSDLTVNGASATVTAKGEKYGIRTSPNSTITLSSGTLNAIGNTRGIDTCNLFVSGGTLNAGDGVRTYGGITASVLIEITGGTVNAYPQYGGHAINCPNITISDDPDPEKTTIVNASAKEKAYTSSGIYVGDGALTIKGGIVNTYGGQNANGVPAGSGILGSDNNGIINISGGVVTAEVYPQGTAISGKDINVTGGTVNAYGGANGFTGHKKVLIDNAFVTASGTTTGILLYFSSDSLTINDSQVVVDKVGGTNNGYILLGSATISTTNSILSDNGNVTVYGEATLKGDLVIETDKKLIFDEPVPGPNGSFVLTIPSGTTLTNNGEITLGSSATGITIEAGGVLKNYGTLNGKWSKIANNGKIYNDGENSKIIFATGGIIPEPDFSAGSFIETDSYVGKEPDYEL